MDVNLIISPVVGAFIGGFANWLAIQMLFYPLTEKRIFGIKIPFTPGLIPKERKRIAEGIADTVSNYFLNEEVVVNAVISPEAEKQFKQYINDLFQKQKNSNETVGQAVKRITGKEFYEIIKEFEDSITEFISGQLREEDIINAISESVEKFLQNFMEKKFTDLLTDEQIDNLKELLIDRIYLFLNSGTFKTIIADLVYNNIDNLKNSNKKLKEILPSELLNSLKSKAIVNSDIIAQLIIDYITSSSVQFKLRKFLKNSFDSSLKLRIISKVIDVDKIFENIFEELIKFLQQPENHLEMGTFIVKLIDTVSEKEISQIMKDYSVELDSDVISKYIDNIITNFIVRDSIKNLLFNDVIDIGQLSLKKVINSVDKRIIDNKREFIRKITVLILDNFHSKTYKDILYTVVNKISEQKVNKLLNYLKQSDIELFQNIVIDNYKKLIKAESDRIFKILNISKIIKDKINSFDIGEMEEIILRVIKKDIMVMRLFEAGIGFVIGLIIPLYSYISESILNLYK